MSNAIGFKAGSTSKRKRKINEEGAHDKASNEITKSNKNMKMERNEPKKEPTTSTSTADNNNVFKEDEADVEQNDRVESSTSNSTHPAMAPKEMYNFCKTLLEMEEGGGVNVSRLKGNAKFNQLLRDNPLFDDSVDINTFQHTFVLFYRWATHLSEVTLSKALHTVMEYVQSEQMVLRHPNFPKRPPNAFTRFTQLIGSDLFKTNEKASADYKNDQDPRVVKAKQEYAKDRERYLAKLREFLTNHTSELFEAQITYLQKEIKNTQKALEHKGHRQSRKPPNGSTKQAQLQLPSAFDLYKRSKGQKYDHLSPEEREAKFRRHYDKLGDEQREIYESIASSLQ